MHWKPKRVAVSIWWRNWKLTHLRHFKSEFQELSTRRQEPKHQSPPILSQRSLWNALKTIIISDASYSAGTVRKLAHCDYVAGNRIYGTYKEMKLRVVHLKFWLEGNLHNKKNVVIPTFRNEILVSSNRFSAKHNKPRRYLCKYTSMLPSNDSVIQKEQNESKHTESVQNSLNSFKMRLYNDF